MPLNLSLALQGSSAIQKSGAASCEPLNMHTTPRTARLGSPYMPFSSATVSHSQNPSLPLSCTPSGNYRTLPRQRGWRGRRRGDWGGGPTHGPYSWHDIYVGRVSLPPASDPKSFSPWNIGLGLESRYLAAPKSSTDFFIPKIIHEPPLEAFNFEEQSETCTTWRGLSSMGAEELFTWTNIYHMVSKQRSKDSPCPVNLSSVAVEMVKFYEQGPPTGLNWFLSAPNIYQRVERFLSMSIGTPNLHTEEHEVPVVGEKYTLSPNVRRSAQRLDNCFTGEIVYSTSESWLIFDESSKVFTGIVPFAPPRNIIVKASVIEFLDEKVHLEHKIRVKMLLRARGSRYPDEYLNEVFMGSHVDHKTDQVITKPRKQVSFADGHDTDSLHSSPDHLKSFFNDLSAMTCDPIHAKNSQQAAFAGRSDTFSMPTPFSEAQGGEIMPEGNSASFKTQDASAEATGSPQRERLANANSSASPSVRQPCSEHGEPVYDKVTSSSAGGVVSAKSRTTGRHSRSCDPSCATCRASSENLGKPFSLYDTDTDIDLDIALGIYWPGDGRLDELPEHAFPKPLAFLNRVDSLSKCSNMDLPTQACNLITNIKSVSQPKDQRIMHDTAFESTTIGFQKSEDVRQLEDFPDSLYQWNWRGWEKEIGITRYPGNKSSVPDLYRGDSASATAIFLTEAGLGDGETKQEAPIDSYEGTIKNKRALPRHENLTGHGNLLSPTLSSTTTDRASRHSSRGSWSMGDDACVLTNATNCVGKEATLYETVRNQFYEDHRSRQMSSIENSESSTTRGTLSRVFSSSSEHPELTHVKQLHMRDKLASYQSEKARGEEPSFSFLMDEAHVRSSNRVSVDQREPDIESIAAAVKNSLAIEVQEQDARETAEIRKGILHHQVMDLERSERRRDLSSSNYDDIFWSSDGASVDDNLDRGIA